MVSRGDGVQGSPSHSEEKFNLEGRDTASCRHDGMWCGAEADSAASVRPREETMGVPLSAFPDLESGGESHSYMSHQEQQYTPVGSGVKSRDDMSPANPPQLQPRSGFSFSKAGIRVRVDLQHVSYKVRRRGALSQLMGKKGQGEQVILQDVNLTFHPGTLVAVMGPSGSGKTTLLRAIHGNPKYAKHVVGDVCANDTPIRKIHHLFRRICCMVPQDDVLLPNFSVWDTLMYAAHLRLPSKPPGGGHVSKADVVRSVLMELGLEKVKEQHVAKVSGGQRRRVSIGLELLVDPSVLLLDEATSGLDSKTTEDICALLRHLARPRLVITTIHQPAYQIFRSFDHVCLMVGGRVAFDGPPADVRPFLEHAGFKTPLYENPADFYIRTIQNHASTVLSAWAIYRPSPSSSSPSAKLTPLTIAPAARRPPSTSTPDLPGSAPPTPQRDEQQPSPCRHLGCHSSHLPHSGLGHAPLSLSLPVRPHPCTCEGSGSTSAASSQHSSSSSSLHHPGLLLEEAGPITRAHGSADWLRKQRGEVMANSMLWETGVLLCRMLQDAGSDPVKLLVGVLIEAAVGVLLGLGWYKLPILQNKSIWPIMGCMIMLCTLGVMDACLAICLRFPTIRALHFREYSNGYYRLPSYAAASLLSGCLLCSLYQLVQGMIVYAMVGLQWEAGKVALFVLIVLLSAWIGSALGFLIGVVTSEVQLMQHYLTPVLMPMCLYAGYMLPYPLIPSYLKPVYWVSIYQYIYSAFVINHFRGLVFEDCTEAAGLLGLCAHTGEEVLAKASLEASQLPETIAAIFGLFGTTCLLAFLILRCKSH